MRQPVVSFRVVSLCLMPLLPLFALPAHASEERQLVSEINAYRAHPRGCSVRPPQALAPLALKSSLALPIGYGGPLRDGLKQNGYQAVTVRTIRLVGAQDAEEAFDMLQGRYCGALLDGQYADIGISRGRYSTVAWVTRGPRARPCWPRSTRRGPGHGCVGASVSPPPGH